MNLLLRGRLEIAIAFSAAPPRPLTLARPGKGAIAAAMAAGPSSFSATSSKYDHVPPGTVGIEFSAQLPAIFTVRLLPRRKYSGSWGIVSIPKIPGIPDRINFTDRPRALASTSSFLSLSRVLSHSLSLSLSLSTSLAAASCCAGVLFAGAESQYLRSRVALRLFSRNRMRAKNFISSSTMTGDIGIA